MGGDLHNISNELNKYLLEALGEIRDGFVSNKIVDEHIIDDEISKLKTYSLKNMQQQSDRSRLEHFCRHLLKIAESLNGASASLARKEINAIYKKTVEKLPKSIVYMPENVSEDEKNAFQTLLSVAHKIPFFNGLTAEEIVGLIYDVKVLTYKVGATIFSEGEKDRDNMFYLLRGKVLVSKCNRATASKVRLAVIDKPALFGEMMRLTNEPRNATVESLDSKTLVVSFKVKDFKENTPLSKFYKNVINELSEKIKNMNKKLY